MTPKSQAVWGRWHGHLVVMLVAIVLMAPFLGKALHIDDPMYVYAAEQILKNPLDFYGAEVNWYGTPQPMWEINKNPPLVSYFIALIMAAIGGSEAILHTAFLLPALGLTLGIWRLARHCGANAEFSALTAVATPVFLVSATSVMSDTLMLALYVWALNFWITGVTGSRHRDLAVSMVLASLAILTKYFAVTLIPLLAAYSLIGRRGPRFRLAWLLVPVAVVWLYDQWTARLYGDGLFSMAMAYDNPGRLLHPEVFARKTLTGLSFAGGCFAGIIFLVPLLWRRWWITPLLFAFGLLLFERLIAGPLGSLADIAPEFSGDSLFRFQLAFFVTLGLMLTVVALQELRRHRDPLTALLVLLFFGALFFGSYMNWTTNGRSIYPMLPAVAVLVARRVGRNASLESLRPAHMAALTLSAGLGIIVAWGDQSLANTQRSAAEILSMEYRERHETVRFQGHWGFQHYMTRAGFRQIDFESLPNTPPGVLVSPRNNTNVRPMPFGQPDAAKVLRVNRFPVVTIDGKVGAGFYSDLWGMLPYAFDLGGMEEYSLHEFE